MNEAERYLEEKARTKTSPVPVDRAQTSLAGEVRLGSTPESHCSVNDPCGIAGASPKHKGLAIASLVCAILGGYASTLTIPAIVCGHLALNKIKKDPQRNSGRGLAIAGLVIGYFGLILALALGTVRSMAKTQLQESLERYEQSGRGY